MAITDSEKPETHKMTLQAKLYVSWVVAAGLTVFAVGMIRWQSTGLGRFLAFLFVAQIVSTQKIRLPGMKGTMSPSFLFMLIGIANFSFAETLVLGCTAAFVQTLWRAKQPPRLEQVFFNISTMVLCAGFSDWGSHALLELAHSGSLFLLVAVAACLFLALNTALVSGVISLTEQKPLYNEWLHCFYWSLPYFFAGALAASSVSSLSRSAGWPSGLMVLPLIYLCHVWYKVHVSNAAQKVFLERDNTRVAMPEEESVLAKTLISDDC